MTTTTNLIERLRKQLTWLDGTQVVIDLMQDAADLLEAQALDLDIQAGSIEAVQAANSRLSAQIEAQAKQTEADALMHAEQIAAVRLDKDRLSMLLGDASVKINEQAQQIEALQAKLSEIEAQLIEVVAQRDAIAVERDSLQALPLDRSAFLVNATRFKLSLDEDGKVNCFWNFKDELDGRWVALVAAENDCHLKSAAPVAPAQQSAERTLISLGYTNHGGKYWKPPLGKVREAQPVNELVEAAKEVAEKCIRVGSVYGTDGYVHNNALASLSRALANAKAAQPLTKEQVEKVYLAFIDANRYNSTHSVDEAIEIMKGAHT